MENGFSLIELVAVTAILGLLATAGVPMFQRWQQQQQYALAIASIHALLTHTQQQARDRAQDQIADLETLDISESIAVSSNFTPAHQVQFTANRGMAGFGAGTITLQHTGFSTHQVRIVVSSLGRIRLCETHSLFARIPSC